MWNSYIERLMYLQSQCSVERSNQDVRCKTAIQKQWSEGLRLIQNKKNRSLPDWMRKCPYKLLFSSTQRNRLANSTVEKHIIFEKLVTKENFKQVLNKSKVDQMWTLVCEDPEILQIIETNNLSVHTKSRVETEN